MGDPPTLIPERNLACHQATSLGIPDVYLPLAGSEWVTGHQESHARILINGSLEVAGKSFNGNMPAFGPAGLNLNPQDLAGVLTYIRQEWDNGASEVTEASVNGYMDQFGSRGTPWNAERSLPIWAKRQPKHQHTKRILCFSRLSLAGFISAGLWGKNRQDVGLPEMA